MGGQDAPKCPTCRTPMVAYQDTLGWCPECGTIQFWPAQGEGEILRPRQLGHTSGCATRVSPGCIYLADGSKVVICRDPKVKGRVWLERREQAVLRTQAPATTKTTRRRLTDTQLGRLVAIKGALGLFGDASTIDDATTRALLKAKLVIERPRLYFGPRHWSVRITDDGEAELRARATTT